MSFLRLSLWFAAVLTASGAFMFAFPGSALSARYDLPADVPVLYRALLGFILLLMAAMYAWLASQRDVYRPLLFLIDDELNDTHYGCREFGIQDLDGHDIAFGQVLDDD